MSVFVCVRFFPACFSIALLACFALHRHRHGPTRQLIPRLLLKTALLLQSLSLSQSQPQPQPSSCSGEKGAIFLPPLTGDLLPVPIGLRALFAGQVHTTEPHERLHE